MSTILFDKIIYGPLRSRRLGLSLGVNLFPNDGKLCNFNCIYCECGYNEDFRPHTAMPQREDVKAALSEQLRKMQKEEQPPDVITFAGNGEPTMHPDFAEIIEDTIALRNEYCQTARIAVLSNSTMLHKPTVFAALRRVDDCLLKVDSVLDKRIQQINVPNQPYFTYQKLIGDLCRFEGNLIIQTMFLKGEKNGESVDNTTTEEVDGWVEALKKIRPRKVMIYTIDRETPLKTLQKVSKEELEAIADKARAEGFEVSVSA